MSNTIILEPHSLKTNVPAPFCMVFHGNDSAPQAHAEYWQALTSLGWLVALPQSSRVGNQPNAFIWNTPGLAEWNFQEIQDHFIEIWQNYLVDETRIIMAGFSMGGGLAIELVLGGHIKANGFVVVAPYIPYKYVDSETNYSDFVKTQAKHGYCIIGEQDSFAVEGTSVLASRLPSMGISCFVEQHTNLEHDYPLDFENSLPKAVEYVISI